MGNLQSEADGRKGGKASQNSAQGSPKQIRRCKSESFRRITVTELPSTSSALDPHVEGKSGTHKPQSSKPQSAIKKAGSMYEKGGRPSTVRGKRVGGGRSSQSSGTHTPFPEEERTLEEGKTMPCQEGTSSGTSHTPPPSTQQSSSSTSAKSVVGGKGKEVGISNSEQTRSRVDKGDSHCCTINRAKPTSNTSSNRTGGGGEVERETLQDALALPHGGRGKLLRRESDIIEPKKRTLQDRRNTNAEIAIRMSHGRHKKPAVTFSTAQINTIRTIWNAIKKTKGDMGLGNMIFHRLIFKAPGIKESLNKLPLSSLKGKYASHDAMQKQHAKSITEVVDKVIMNMEDLDSITEYLEEVGEKHAFLHEFGLTPKVFNLFADAFIDCTLEWGDKSQRKDETRKAWAVIVSLTVEKVKNGFIEGRKRSYFKEATPQPLPNTPSAKVGQTS